MKYAICFGIVGAIICGLVLVSWLKLKNNCTGRLERAANASTVELAQVELSSALGYIETHGLNKGSTAILFDTPDADLEYWYKNIKSSKDELDKVTPETSALERTNILMKLRETLTDDGKNGRYLVKPPYLLWHPYQRIIVPIIWLIVFGFIALAVWAKNS